MTEKTPFEKRQRAMREILSAVEVHADHLLDEVKLYGTPEHIKAGREEYVRQLRGHARVFASLQIDGETKLMQRLADLDLEEATDLLLAVEDHIRSLRGRAYAYKF